MKKLTKFQTEELLGLLEVRRETIEQDPDSADEFETIESLSELEKKLESYNVEFTKAEKAWMIEELECRIEVFADFNDPEEQMSRMASIKSLQGAIEKLYQP